MEERCNKNMMGELDQNIRIKEENESSYLEDSLINENVHIKDNIILSKEDNTEIYQQVYIKEEELSCDEDSNIVELCNDSYGNESPSMNGHLMDIDYKHADINVPLAGFPVEKNNVDMDYQCSDRDDAEENFSNKTSVEETFGNHFLSAFEEPQEGVQNQSEKNSIGLAPGTGWIESDQLKDKGVLCDDSQENLFIKLGRGLIKCTKCRYTTRALKKFNFHKKYWCGKKLDTHNCIYCDFKCTNKSNLYHHVTKHSFGDAVIECPYCRFISLSFLEVQDHIQKKHNKPKTYYNCEQCEYRSQFRCNLEYHIAAKHTLEKNFACVHCDYKSVNVHGWRRHMLAQHNTKIPYKRRTKKTFFY